MAPRIYNAYIQTYNTLEKTLEFYIYFVIRNTRSPQNSQLSVPSVGHFLVLFSLRFTERGDDSDLVCICKIVLRPKKKLCLWLPYQPCFKPPTVKFFKAFLVLMQVHKRTAGTQGTCFKSYEKKKPTNRPF